MAEPLKATEVESIRQSILSHVISDFRFRRFFRRKKNTHEPANRTKRIRHSQSAARTARAEIHRADCRRRRRLITWSICHGGQYIALRVTSIAGSLQHGQTDRRRRKPLVDVRSCSDIGPSDANVVALPHQTSRQNRFRSAARFL